jgi:outer membrane immunogenic protein
MRLFRSKGALLNATLSGAVALLATGDARADGPPRGWTGLYGGVSIGYGWGKGGVGLTGDDPMGTVGAGNGVLGVALGDPSFAVNPYSAVDKSKALNSQGMMGGAQIGYNLPLGALVAGIEADVQLAGINGNTSSTGSIFFVTNRLDINQKLDWFGTVRGRLGYLASDKLLIFGTGGLAYGRTQVDAEVGSLRGYIIEGGFPVTVSRLSCVTGTICI